MPGPGYAFLGEEERANVLEVLDNWDLTRYSYDVPNWISFVRRFELATQDFMGSNHCLAVNSCTSALITGLAALGIGPGDEVIVPGYTFIAPIGAVVYSGATPVLAEIDTSLTFDPRDVEARITPRTRAILAVHMLGAPCDLAALRDIADRHGIFLIEDVAQACGASYRGRRLGTIGDVGAFSLNLFKVITCGEGGFLLTDNSRLYQRAFGFHDQGWYPLRTDTGDGDIMVGLNLRMAELSGAVACAQLDKLDTVLKTMRDLKRDLADRIGERPGVRRRLLHDAEGECATLLVYLFDRPEDAGAVAAALGTKTMIQSGRHYYRNMVQLSALADQGTSPAPFRRPDPEHPFDIPNLPRTDDILARAVALSIGVSDRYMGSGFGLTVRSTPAEVEMVASTFSATLDGVLGH